MRTTYVTAITAAIVLLVGCGGGSDDDDVAATTVREPITCTAADGSTFVSTLATCDEAFSKGQELAADLQLATQADSPAAAAAVASTCAQLQGTEQVVYDEPAVGEFATKLDSSGVCPGTVDNFVLAGTGSATTAPAVVLITTAGWTLVEVVDGDTLDVISQVEGQRRIDLIGINAPEPGECLADEATNALRLLAADKELKLVPDMSDANAEGNNVRYIESLDGVDLGGTMIDLGFAKAESIEPDIARADTYTKRMNDATRDELGLWAPNACPPPTVPATTAAPTAAPGTSGPPTT